VEAAIFDVDSGEGEKAGAALACRDPTRVDEIFGPFASLAIFSQPFKEFRFEDIRGNPLSAIDCPSVQGFKCVRKLSSAR